MKLNNIQSRLIQALESEYSPSWSLTTLDGSKRPYRPDWQKENPLPHNYIVEAIRVGEEVTYRKKDGNNYTVRKFPQGLGLRTGEISEGVLAIDFDGKSATPLFEKLFGEIPLTAIFTSRIVTNLKEGELPERFQILLIVPKNQWQGLKNRTVFKTGVKDKNGKEEQLELRWNNSQSVLPGSVHPETGLYSWVTGRSFKQVGVAIASDKIIEALKEQPAHSQQQSNQREKTPNWHKTPTGVAIPLPCTWTQTEWAAYYMERLSIARADNYDGWTHVGMSASSP